jgi:CubicO group peptidase (beta-lactamase class C family)
VSAVLAALAAASLSFPEGALAQSSKGTTDIHGHASVPAVIEATDHFVVDQLSRTSIPGAAIALTHNGEVVHVRGFGHDSDGRAVTADTLFRIASLSKSFTSLAVMQLVDQERVSLDDRVTDILPEFRPADPRAAEITVAEVLNQTSGFADHAFNELSGPQPHTLAAAVSRLNETHLVSDPGKEWHYFNPNYEIAARIVEVASGEEFNGYLSEHVLVPAGMTSSVADNTDNSPVPGLAKGHVALYGRQIPVGNPDTFGAGAGGVVSTASDMARWLVVQTNEGQTSSGKQLVSAPSLMQMHTASTSSGYAYGWSVRRRPGEPTRIAHTGNLSTFSSYQALLPDSGYGVALLFNSASVLTTDQTAIYTGVLDILSGTDMSPDGARPTAATIDYALGAVTLVILVLGVRGVLNARRWTRRRTRTPTFARTRTCLRLLPSVAVLGVAATFPAIAELVFARAVDWTAALYAWPAVVALVLAAFLASSATLLTRVGLLLVRWRSTATG